MHPERVIIARVSAIIVVTIVVGAFGSLLVGHLFPLIQIIIISSGGRP
jgi:hypothetical protein